MITIENKSLKEFKVIRTIMIFLIVSLFVLVFFVILTLINHQFSFQSVKFFFYGFLIVLAFLNYLRNLSSTRYFSVSISLDNLSFMGIKKECSFKVSEIRRIVYLRQHDISGITNYMIIMRKRFKGNIFLSDFKSKSCDLKKLNENNQLDGIEVLNIRNSFLSQIVLSFFMTLSI